MTAEDWERERGGLAERNGGMRSLFWPGSAALSQGMVSHQHQVRCRGTPHVSSSGGGFQPPAFVVTPGDGSCWGFCIFHSSLLCSCPAVPTRVPAGAGWSPQHLGSDRTGVAEGSGPAGRAGLLSPGKRDGISHCGMRAHSSLFPQEQGEDNAEIPSESLFHQ